MPSDGSCAMLSRHYNATMFVCLLASIGVCLPFLQIIPLKMPNCSSVFMVVRRICMVILGLAVFIPFAFLLRHQKKLHREGLILWPMRCRHCAQLLGLRAMCSTFIQAPRRSRFTTLQRPGPSPSSSAIPASPNGPSGTDSTFCCRYDNISVPDSPCLPIGDEHSSEDGSQREGALPPGNSCAPSTRTRQYNTMINGDSPVKQSTFSAHRSMVNVFNMFGIWVVIGIMCILTGEMTCRESFLHVLSYEEADISLMLMIPFAMLFFTSYHDAVFVATTANCTVVAIFLSWGLWMVGVKLNDPLQPLMNSSYNQPCDLSETIKTLYDYGATRMAPIYAEFSIIATAMFLQMWNSLIPKSALKRDDTDSQHLEWQEQSLSSRLKGVRTTCRSYFNHMCWPNQMRSRGEWQRLLTWSCPEILTHVYRTWTICFCMGLSYFILNVTCIEMPNMFTSSTIQVIVLWVIEIAYLVPLITLLVNESFTYMEASSTSVFSREMYARKLKGHDVLLLLCICGIFSQNFFRLSAAVGVLFRGGSLSDGDDIHVLLSLSAIIYSIVITIVVWLTTAFLLNAQRLSQDNLDRTKWNISSLVYIMFINGAEWVIRTFLSEIFPIHLLFFGKTTGRVIGVLLDPFGSLYLLHTTMVAYETYKVIMRELRLSKNFTSGVRSSQSGS